MRTPPSYLFSIGRVLLFILIEVCSIALIANNDGIQQLAINKHLRIINVFFWEKANDIKGYFKLGKLNNELSEQNAALLEENEWLRITLAMQENDTLLQEAIRNLPDTAHGFSYKSARVVKNTLNTTHNYIIIDKGYNDGVRADAGVITPNGIVGIIRSVGANYSLVISFLNTKQQVSAKLGESKMFGPLAWDGISDNRAILSEIPQHTVVEIGDIVYTSGYSSIYPANIPLGQVKSSRIVNGMHKEIEVILFQDYRLLDHVIITQNRGAEEIDSLSADIGRYSY